jgi:hypothetical protein
MYCTITNSGMNRPKHGSDLQILAIVYSLHIPIANHGYSVASSTSLRRSAVILLASSFWTASLLDPARLIGHEQSNDERGTCLLT